MLDAALLTMFLVGSGIGDGRGFVHASRVWTDDGLQARELARSATWFALGIGLYWASLYWARRAGVVSPVVQTLLWFTATVVGVAIASREFGGWPTFDKLLALALAVGLGTMLVRHA